MKKFWFYGLIWALALAMLCGMASCGEKTPSKPDDSESESGTVEEKPDFGDYTFTVMTEDCPFQNTQFDCEEYTIAVIDSALYTRNRGLEETYHLRIVEKPVEIGTPNDLLKTDILGGVYTYDLVFGMANYSFNGITEGYYRDLNEVKSLDLSATCWDQNAGKDLSIKNRLFCTVGDLHCGGFDMVSVLLLNEDLWRSLDLEEDPRQLALSGDWTFEKMDTMVKGAAADLDGIDNELSLDDRYGVSSTTAIFTNLMVGAGQNFFTKNSEDIPEFSAGTDAFSNVYSSMLRMITKSDSYILNDQNDTYRDSFNSGKALFMGGIICDLNNAKLRDSKINYSPLPLPKYSTMQTRYYSAVNFQAEVMYMPIGKDVDRTGKITQLICEASTGTLRSHYYEEVLKIQRVKDGVASSLVDLIYNTRCYDIGLICLWGNVRSVFNNTLAGSFSETGLGYFAQVYGTSATTERDAFIQAFEEMLQKQADNQ